MMDVNDNNDDNDNDVMHLKSDNIEIMINDKAKTGKE